MSPQKTCSGTNSQRRARREQNEQREQLEVTKEEEKQRREEDALVEEQEEENGVPKQFPQGIIAGPVGPIFGVSGNKGKSFDRAHLRVDLD